MSSDTAWQARMAVVTPESVSFSYEVAGIGSRFLALLVDHVIESLAFLGLILTADSLGWLRHKYVAWFILASVGLANILYFIVFESIWDGQTPGKRLMRLRVVRDGGYGLTVFESILRNLLRAIDFLPIFYAAGLLAMFISPQSRRLGDFAAGTLVVKDQPAPPPELDRLARSSALAALPPEIGVGLRGRLELFAPEELRIMREYIRRRAGLTPEARRGLLDKLCAAILARLPELEAIPDGPRGEQLIEAVVALYEEHLAR